MHRLALLLVIFYLSACQDYLISVNQKVVYEPPILFSEYSIADHELKECVRKTIQEQALTRAEQLEKLGCPAGNIELLDGLEVFSNLKAVGFADNKIRNIEPLAGLGRLERINLANNEIKDVVALQGLKGVKYLNLSGNAGLSCGRIAETKVELENESGLICDD